MICYSLAQIVTLKQGKNKFTGHSAVSCQLAVVSCQWLVGAGLNQDFQDF